MNNSSMDHFLNEIQRMLALIESRRNEPLAELPAEILAQVEQLEKGIQILQQATQEALQQEGLKDDFIKQVLESPKEKIPPKQAKLLTKIEKIKEFAEREKRHVTLLMQSARMKEKSSGKTADPNAASRRRRKKFDRLGGDNKWLPL